MKHVVEYKLHGDQTPYFIQDGGYFPNNGKLIGVTFDDVSCYVPPNTQLVTYDDQSSFVTHIVSLTINDKDGNPLTSDQKTTLANSWWVARQ